MHLFAEFGSFSVVVKAHGTIHHIQFIYTQNTHTLFKRNVDDILYLFLCLKYTHTIQMIIAIKCSLQFV